MEIKFIQDQNLINHEIQIEVKSNELNKEVIDLLATLEKLSSSSDLIPIKVEDQIKLVNQSEIVAVEVNDSILTFHMLDEEIETKGNLKNILMSLNHNFIKISKFSIINLKKLASLEASFSGNMTSFMKNGLKITVSRRYLNDLRERIGL
ncbi:MAG: LytTR family DNA-binding domain-containing protein [Rickettsia endosymbiont of Ixodes persulcatus]|nr:LytTR family DNA-binding domain-containing protein [Rickettsia endosymbiont of Ixodes persulcatus]